MDILLNPSASQVFFLLPLPEKKLLVTSHVSSEASEEL